MSAEKDSLRCSLRCLCAMYQIQDHLPFHPHQHDEGAQTIEVSLASSGNRNLTQLERLNGEVLIQPRDKRVEELEKRLKFMEDAMRGPVSDQQSDSIDTNSGVYSGRPEAPPITNPSEAGNLDLDTTLNPISTMADENPQVSEIGLPPPEGKCESAMDFLI